MEDDSEEEVVFEMQKQEERHKLSIFPAEVWELIFSKITEARDMEAAYQVSSYFRTLLLPQRPLFLFPSVWPILAIGYQRKHNHYNDNLVKRYKGLHGTVLWGKQGKICSSCGSLRTKRWYSEMLNLRLVCRTWSQAIDSFFASTLPSDFGKKINLLWSTPLREDRFLATVPMQSVYPEFLQHFKDSHWDTDRNPFLGRAVTLMYGAFGLRFDTSFVRGMKEILTQFGGHIWYCHLSGCDTRGMISESYSRLVSFLELMPNLKVLHLEYNSYSSPTPEEIGELEAEMKLRPLPTFSSLQLLRTRGPSTDMFNQLRHRNNHVTMLDIDNE